MSTIPQLATLKQRMRARALQQAQYGISADPSVTTELRDLETVIGMMERIDIHRRNLAHLLQQRGHFGPNVPAHIVNSITSEREKVAELRAACARYNQPVNAHEVDSEPALTASEPAPVPLPTDPIQAVREQLRDVEAMIRHGQYDAALRLIVALRDQLGD